jgi:hypothetical protein
MASVDQGLSITSVFAYTNGLSGEGDNPNNEMLYINSSIINQYRSNEPLQEVTTIDQNYVFKTYYVMRGKDIDCVPVTYRIWTVLGAPDTAGSYYTGVKCGSSPLADVTIVSKYQA